MRLSLENASSWKSSLKVKLLIKNDDNKSFLQAYFLIVSNKWNYEIMIIN